MIRDRVPYFTRGGVISNRDLPYYLPRDDNPEDRGPDPTRGVLGRFQSDHPLLAAAASMALAFTSMKVSGDLVRKGAVRLGASVDDARWGGYFQSQLNQLRRVGTRLDEWADFPTRPDGSVIRNFSAAGERTRDLRASRFLRQHAVSAARRLPYELPAAWLTERFILDPMIYGGGYMRERKQEGKNWANPFAMATDFAKTSVKNVLFAALPFEAALGVGKYTYANLATNPNASWRFAHGYVGQMFGSATGGMMNYMNRSVNTMGAFNSALGEWAASREALFPAKTPSEIAKRVFALRERGKRSGREVFDEIFPFKRSAQAFKDYKSKVGIKSSLEQTVSFLDEWLPTGTGLMGTNLGVTVERAQYARYLEKRLKASGASVDDIATLRKYTRLSTKLPWGSGYLGPDDYLFRFNRSRDSLLEELTSSGMGRNKARQLTARLFRSAKGADVDFAQAYDRGDIANIAKNRARDTRLSATEVLKKELGVKPPSVMDPRSALRALSKELNLGTDDLGQIQTWMKSQGMTYSDVQFALRRRGKLLGSSYNPFGLRKMMATELVGKHGELFSSDDIAKRAARQLSALGNRDTVNKLYAGKGYYVNRKGQAINLNFFKDVALKGIHGFSKNFKLPFVHFNPLNLLGARGLEQIETGRFIRMASPGAYEPALRGLKGVSASGQVEDFILKVRHGRSRKFTATVMGEGYEPHTYRHASGKPMLFREENIGKNQFSGRLIRRLFGIEDFEAGARKGFMGGLADMLSVSQNKDRSIFNYLRRRLSRSSDPNYLGNIVKKLSSGDIDQDDLFKLRNVIREIEGSSDNILNDIIPSFTHVAETPLISLAKRIAKRNTNRDSLALREVKRTLGSPGILANKGFGDVKRFRQAIGAHIRERIATFGDDLVQIAEDLESVKAYILPQDYLKMQTAILSAQLTKGTQGIGNLGNIFFGARQRARGKLASYFEAGRYTPPGSRVYPFGEVQETISMPTLGTAISRGLDEEGFWGGAKAFGAGLGVGADPTKVSAFSLIPTHLVSRLTMPLERLGLGFQFADFGGAADIFARGFVGKRLLPVAFGAAAFNTLERTLGYDPETGTYTPAIRGALANAYVDGTMGLSNAAHKLGLTDNFANLAEILGVESLGAISRTPEQQDRYWQQERPVRRGRYWVLGSESFFGGRTQYHVPNWYQRLMSGHQYAGDLWDSPIDEFYHTWGPGRLLSPYEAEKRTYHTRPYPVTSPFFQGPWGPLTPILNATVGAVIKPQRMMHRQELEEGLAQDHAGFIGPGGGGRPTGQPSIATLYGGGSVRLGTPIVGTTTPGSQAEGIIASQNQAIIESAQNVASAMGRGNFGVIARQPTRMGESMSVRSGEYAFGNVRQAPVGSSSGAQAISKIPTLPLRTPERDTRMFSGDPLNPMSPSAVGSEIAYTFQELAGFYGFAFGSFRQGVLGQSMDYSARASMLARPEFTSAQYKFWNMGLGGLGDIMLPMGSIELSEIMRRFVPKKRTDIEEVNPIPNAIYEQNPWLPSRAEYFQGFDVGDPMAAIPRGEIRLPGRAYEALHGLHSDEYGRYGLLDQYRILADVAPWSDQFKLTKQLIAAKNWGPEEQMLIQETQAQVTDRNREYRFSPYRFAKQDLESQEFIVKGVNQHDPNLIEVEGMDTPIRLAGVRLPKSPTSESGLESRSLLGQALPPGTRIKATFDRNQGVLPNRERTLDAVVEVGGTSLNEELLRSGYSESRTKNPIDLYARHSTLGRLVGAGVERITHIDNPIISKVFHKRTATEEYERKFVYGIPFSQWQHPIESFLKPMAYKRTQWGPVYAGVTGVMAGMMFGQKFGVRGASGTGRLIGGIIGGVVGVGASLYGKAYEFVTGRAFVPKEYAKNARIEEYVDALQFVKYAKLYNEARQLARQAEGVDVESIIRANEDRATMGRKSFWEAWRGAPVGKKPNRETDLTQMAMGPYSTLAIEYRQRMKQTLYGADLFGDYMNLYMAMPRYKREFFQEFINAPEGERERILRVLPRMERRILEAKWRMPIEPRPALADIFSQGELPPPQWEGWRPEINLEDVKIKIMQHQGVDMSRGGFYPQQVMEANLQDISYPDINRTENTRSTLDRLREFFALRHIDAQVVPMPTPYAGTQVFTDFREVG